MIICLKSISSTIKMPLYLKTPMLFQRKLKNIVKLPFVDDSILILKLKQKDEFAYKLLYDKYYQTLCNYIYNLCEDKSLSEDIVQDTLINFYVKRKKIKIKTSLKNYLFKSCYNNFLQYLRKKKIKFDDLDTIKWEVISNTMMQEKDDKENKLKQLHQCIDELPPKCREILIENKINKVKYKDIAKEKGISIKTVENQMLKALKHLRKMSKLILF